MARVKVVSYNFEVDAVIWLLCVVTRGVVAIAIVVVL